MPLTIPPSYETQLRLDVTGQDEVRLCLQHLDSGEEDLVDFLLEKRQKLRLRGIAALAATEGKISPR
ncbi:hypothetical protein GYMLUDRAFT_237858 [Collybiopsis luxurians FD-317 M1]|nr:hypothetical protein GYMLUDRAFT_237858 [Collybiopsis luxurians FD-317 M1]